MSHRYAVGQVLEMRSSPHTNTRPAGPCEVLFLQSHDSGPVLYRVKPFRDRVERVVAEADLSPSEATRLDMDGFTLPLTVAINRR